MSSIFPIESYLDSKENSFKCFFVEWFVKGLKWLMIFTDPVVSSRRFYVNRSLNVEGLCDEIYGL